MQMTDLISRSEALDQIDQSYNIFDARHRLEALPSADSELTRKELESDTVSRKAVLEIIRSYFPAYRGDENTDEECSFGMDLGYMMEEVEKLPKSCQELPNWIPCSEKMPERDGLYFVTVMTKGEGEIYVTTSSFYGTFHDRSKNFWDDYADVTTVLAWQPLPEPYVPL